MISVVIPTLDEESTLGATLADLHGQEWPHEVIVADGGSRDRTCAIALQGGARLVHAPAGRARQMNEGARAAQGEILLFLHADTRLPEQGLAAAARTLEDPARVGGGFLKRYRPSGPALWLLALALNQVRTRLLRQFVGSQAMFVRREVFLRLEGFRDWPLLEDVELSDRLRRSGALGVVARPVTASSRRYLGRGTLRQIGRNAAILAAFRLGLAPERLARWYADRGEPA